MPAAPHSERAAPVATPGEPAREGASDESAGARVSGGRWLIPVIIAGYLGIAIYYNRFVVTGIGHRIPPGQDGILFAWYLEWTKDSILHLHNPFVSGALNAPVGFNVTWNTWLPLFGVLLVPLVAAVGPFTTVSLLIVISPAAAASSLYLVIRRVVSGFWGPALAGLLYGFGPWTVGHYDHLNLLFTPLLPVIGLLGYRLVTNQSTRPVRTGIWLGLLLAAQFLLSEELLALVSVVAAGAVLSLVLVCPRRVREWIRRASVGFATAGLVALVVCALPLYYQLFGPFRLHQVANAGQSADLASFVRSGPLQLSASGADLRADAFFPANSAESTAYLGWPLLALVVVFIGLLIARRDVFAGWWLLVTVGAAGLSLGPAVRFNGKTILPHAPWSPFQRVPLLHSALPVRFSLFTALLVAVLIAYVLAGLRGWASLVAVVAVGLAFLPLVPRLQAEAWEVVPTPAFFTTDAVHAIPAGADVVVYPFPKLPEVSAMVWQARSEMRFDLVGGYSQFNDGSGRSTPFGVEPAPVALIATVGSTGIPLTATQSAAARAAWPALGLRYIVIATDYQPHAAEVVAAAVEVTGCTPRITGGVTVCVTP